MITKPLDELLRRATVQPVWCKASAKCAGSVGYNETTGEALRLADLFMVSHFGDCVGESRHMHLHSALQRAECRSYGCFGWRQPLLPVVAIP